MKQHPSPKTWGRVGAFLGVLTVLFAVSLFGLALQIPVLGVLFHILLLPVLPVLYLLSWFGMPIGMMPPVLRIVFLLSILLFYGWAGYRIGKYLAERRLKNDAGQ